MSEESYFVDLFAKKTVVYDGKCSFCLQFIKNFEKLDKTNNFKKVPAKELYLSLKTYFETHTNIQTELGITLKELSLEQLSSELHLVTPNKIFKGELAMQEIFLELPALRPFNWLLKSKIGKKSTTLLYKGMRHIRNRCKKCE